MLQEQIIFRAFQKKRRPGILSDISTWIPHEYQLNQTYGANQAAFSPYLTALREELKKDTLQKIEDARHG